MYIQKAVILDSAAVGRSLMRISHEIIESAEGEKSVCIIGIRRRGVPLARRIAENIRKFSDIDVQVGELDISLYRDDLSETGSQANLNGTDVGFPVEGRTVVLVDDVLYTGRTARAAIEAVIHMGRPSRLRLAVLVDRGHRELPIRADYVGKNVPTSPRELIAVRVPEYDGCCEAAILEEK